jgi:N6-adenosine-specific RNA methylase IME4
MTNDDSPVALAVGVYASLQTIEDAKRLLVEVRDLSDIRAIHDAAEAMRTYAKAAGLGLAAQNHAAEIRLRAERRGGELLAAMPKNRGTAGAGRPPLGGYIVSPPKDDTPTLAEVFDKTPAAAKSAAARWESEAAVPEPDFEAYVAETIAADKEITSAGLMQLASTRTHDPAAEVAFPEGKYRCLVIDPPWPMEKIERTERPRQGDKLDYRTMSLDEIAALDIPSLAHEEGCHVYLWVTHRFLPAGLDLFREWGVTYQCLMTWVKNVGFTPFSWMYDTEHVLFGRVGHLPLTQLGLRLSFSAPVTRHSEKPPIFYDRVRAASPGPRRNLFARQEIEGFESWGDEV